MNQHFKIIIACRNVEKWIECCLKTLLGQHYKDWTGIIIDDCSTDKTCSIINELIKGPDKIILSQNKQRLPKIWNYINAINMSHPSDEDILVFLDGDDWFPDADTLGYLSSIYKESQAWITWGSFIEVDGKSPIVFDDYTKSVRAKGTRPAPSNWKLRRDWRFSHLKSAKYFLWKNIRDESFREEKSGAYFPAAIDLAFMIPMVEMAGPKHSKHITRIMYVYNNGNPQSYMYTMPKKQKEDYHEILKRTPYPQKTKKELL